MVVLLHFEQGISPKIPLHPMHLARASVGCASAAVRRKESSHVPREIFYVVPIVTVMLPKQHNSTLPMVATGSGRSKGVVYQPTSGKVGRPRDLKNATTVFFYPFSTQAQDTFVPFGTLYLLEQSRTQLHYCEKRPGRSSFS